MVKIGFDLIYLRNIVLFHKVNQDSLIVDMRKFLWSQALKPNSEPILLHSPTNQSALGQTAQKRFKVLCLKLSSEMENCQGEPSSYINLDSEILSARNGYDRGSLSARSTTNHLLFCIKLTTETKFYVNSKSSLSDLAQIDFSIVAKSRKLKSIMPLWWLENAYLNCILRL